MPHHGLTEQQLCIIADTLRPFARTIAHVGLFGSRAMGTWRENSDIDLVLYGTIDEREIDRLRTLFEETLLPIRVDHVTNHLVDYPPLKAHIDAAMIPLFVSDPRLDFIQS